MDNMIYNKRKGYTLIELIVVMAILAVLVLLAAPKFLGHTKEAAFTKHISNAKVLEDASERYYIDHGKWPRGLDEEVYTAEEVSAYAERIYDITGEEFTLEEGNYWDIDYEALSTYAKLPDESERANYVLRNPVGKVYYLEGLTEEGEERLPEYIVSAPDDKENNPQTPVEPDEWVLPDYYVLATDADFSGTTDGTFKYIGTDSFVIVPETIKGVPITSYKNMFTDTSVEGVANTTSDVTDMSYMFYRHTAETLDLRGLDTTNVSTMLSMFASSSTSKIMGLETANVKNMSRMFQGAKAASLDFGSFDTRNVTNMLEMFHGSKAHILNLSSFDTRKVTSMYAMFAHTSATSIDLSGFDMRSITSTTNMFYNASLTGMHFARSHYDAKVLSSSTTSKPAGLTFTVNEQPETYKLATDDDFIKVYNGTHSIQYRGASQYVIIPDTIFGQSLTSYQKMFAETGVRGVKSTNANVTNMTEMFAMHQVDTIDLSGLDTSATTMMSKMFHSSHTSKIIGLDTSQVTTMRAMFQGSYAPSLDLSRFNTSKVKDMGYMFHGVRNVDSLDLRAFDTSNVTKMDAMFAHLEATTLDLINFDMGKVTNTDDLFYKATLTGTHAVRSQVEADKLNKSTSKPAALLFVPKN